jgi:tetratricopeptide (TPR) repeat protein
MVENKKVAGCSETAQKSLKPIVLLKAYQAILAHDPTNDLSERYKSLLRTLSNEKDDPFVFSALASSELAKHTKQGDEMAIHDLSEAVRLHSESPRDYLLLSELEYRANHLDAAIATLTLALPQFPYLPTPYENLAVCYSRSGEVSKAREVIHRGLEIFPSDENLLLLDQRTHP